MCVCAFVWPYGQGRDWLMLAAPHVHISAPYRNMYIQLWNSSLRVDDEAEQSIGFKNREWEFSITAKVRTANCL